MRKFKKEIIVSLCILLLNIVISIWSMNYKDAKISFYVNMLRQIQYQLPFSAFFFSLLYDSHDASLILIRTGSVKNFFMTVLLTAIIHYGVVMMLVTAGQCMLFSILDPVFNVVTLLYRNCVFYVLIIFVKYFLTACRKEKQTIWLFMIYIIWSTLFMFAAFFPDNPLDAWNVFSLIRKIDSLNIIRHIILLCICILCMQIRLSFRKRFVKKWLE